MGEDYSRIQASISKMFAGICLFTLLYIGSETRIVVGDQEFVDASTEDETVDLNGLAGGEDIVTQAGGDSGGRYELCANTDVSTILPPPYGNISGLACTPLWNTFVLRYKQRDDNVMTIVCSALYTSGWVGIGFSKDGRMMGSSAMIGWFTQQNRTRINQFYLQGYQPNQVISDQGDLQLDEVPPVMVLHGAMVYLAFQVRFKSRLGLQPIVLAFSSQCPTEQNHLPMHDDKSIIMFDFTRGSAMIIDPDDKERRTHGILGIMGWGILLPLGAIIARQLKHKDLLWYYLHAIIQFMGFIFGFAGVILGLKLYDKINANKPTHRGIGIFLLAASILQVTAFFLKPSKDSKCRKYWNLYHNWLGRIALFFGSFNIVLGIVLADAGNDWKIGYGFLLTLLLVAVIVLEASLRMRRLDKAPTHPPAFQIYPKQ